MNCVLWHKGPGFTADWLTLPAGFDRIAPDLFAKLRCSLCTSVEDQQSGAKVQCAKGKCQAAFHVSCAIAAKYSNELGDRPRIFCPRHKSPLEAEAPSAAAQRSQKRRKSGRKWG